MEGNSTFIMLKDPTRHYTCQSVNIPNSTASLQHPSAVALPVDVSFSTGQMNELM